MDSHFRQVYSVGALGLIFEVSSLLSNVISTMGLPIVPVLALFIVHDKMDGVKAIAMVLAIWGFVSYIYQHYRDDLRSKSGSGSGSGNGNGNRNGSTVNLHFAATK